jgi:hypothetical protein
MNIPSRVKILAHWFDVKQVEPGELEKDCGQTDIDLQRIRINKRLSQDMQEETFVHEILHAINIAVDEETINILAGALYQVLKENNLLR